MSLWSTHAAVVMALVVGGVTAWVVYRTVLNVLRLRHAETQLIERLASDTEFARALVDYLESIYHLGFPHPEAAARIERVITVRATEVGPGGRLIIEAVRQPSASGRERYVQRVTKEALDRIVDLPIEEFEIDPPELPESSRSGTRGR